MNVESQTFKSSMVCSQWVDLHPFYKIQVHKWCDYVLISTMISIKYLTQSAMIEEQIHP